MHMFTLQKYLESRLLSIYRLTTSNWVITGSYWFILAVTRPPPPPPPQTHTPTSRSDLFTFLCIVWACPTSDLNFYLISVVTTTPFTLQNTNTNSNFTQAWTNNPTCFWMTRHVTTWFRIPDFKLLCSFYFEIL